MQHVLAERGYSGGEVQLRHLVAHLEARGHSNYFVLVPGARFAAALHELGVGSERIAFVNLRRPLRPGVGAAMRAAVAAARPDVLHFGCGRSLLWGGWFARHASAPLKVTTRRIDYPIGRSWYRGGRYRRLVDHTVANCESVRQAVLAAGVAPSRVTLVHEGIDVQPWERLPERGGARRRLQLPEAAAVVSCAATLRPRKGQRDLIRAFAQLRGRFPDAVLVLAGEGPDRRRLARFAASLGLGQAVRLPGAISPVADLYAASDVFCMPSHHEGLSNACLEASAAGLPLVVSDAGGLPEIVEDGATGAVVPAGDVPALAAALAGYLADPDRRRRAGAAGAARTRQLFTHSRMADTMEALLEGLLAARHERRRPSCQD